MYLEIFEDEYIYRDIQNFYSQFLFPVLSSSSSFFLDFSLKLSTTVSRNYSPNQLALVIFIKIDMVGFFTKIFVFCYVYR